ncbi:hypothetical protein BGZ76_001052 [Entomortierella beljakovae]|nr:hypothetical protein BGZ76_001052 [Entomortierella beljakovae]
MVSQTDSAEKPVIGAHVNNLLITSSITLAKVLIKSDLPKLIRYINTVEAQLQYSLEALLGRVEAQRLAVVDKLRQVRSKLDCPSAYVMCRASSDITNNSLGRPYTIWTLFDNVTSPATVLQARLALRLFQVVVLQVIRNSSRAKLRKSTVRKRQQPRRRSAA